MILILAAVPMVYSWLYYKKQCARGEGYALDDKPEDPFLKKLTKVSLVIVAVILVFVGLMMFGGKIEYVYEADSFTIDASVWNDLTVEYEAIDSIELRKEAVSGIREYGFGSSKLLLGVFRNEEFGAYTRYTYTKSDSAVVLTVNGNTLVIAGLDFNETQEIYNELTARMEG